MREADIQKAILEYLAAVRCLAFRMNTGVAQYEGESRLRRVPFGVKGMADILAFHPKTKLPVWIEVKTETGRQSEYQKSFQRQVESHGHVYVLARSIDDVQMTLCRG